MITPSFALTATERVLPKMALDFTTASLDPRVTFTRSGNTATVVNSSGYIAPINANLPRFDYDPTTLICKGLLIEESRTNVMLQSENFDILPWAKGNATIVAGALTAPDNNLTASKLVEDSLTNTHLVTQAILYTSGTAYTCSIFAKAGERTFIQLRINASSQFSASFDLVNGTASQASAGTTAAIRSAGNGWFRCSITFTATATAAGSSRIGLMLNATTQSYAGDGTSGAYIWGAQLEAGAFPTSYIPTVLTQVTRTADIATMTGTNFSDWYSTGAGGVVAGVLPSTVSGTRPALQFDDNTANEIIALRGNTTNPELYIVDGGTPQAQIDAGTIAANTDYDLGAAWDTNNCAAAVNGGATVTDITASIPTVTQARLGSDGTNYLNGQLQTVRYWPQRIINAEVQAFSK